MKKFLIVIAIIVIGYLFIVKRVTVNVGEEAVIIKKPWFFGAKGIEKDSISTGTIWSITSSEIKIISLKAFTIEDSLCNLFTKDNIPVDFNISLVFKYKKGEGSTLIENFGGDREWYTNLVSKPLHNSMEVAIKKQIFNDLYYDENITNEIKKDILFGVRDLIKKRAIPVNLIDIIIGKITPPKEIIESAIKRETQKDRIAFHQLRKEAEKTSAEADRAYMIKMNMTPKEYIKMKEIELDTKKLANQRYAIDHAKDSNGTIKVKIDMGK
ncbi:hypothetical protein MNB_SV-12-1442 [hydrothermal vent metagenome]|uniref:Band 7 domain-containing protein n=1 Tax=hydrothermal vent metagenome TaxID=652676 RepID=A0A1W1CEM8_9ZZZZ